MSNKVPQPIFTLRGHNVGVTALTYYSTTSWPYLVSGDEEGSICIWDLAVFRRLVVYPNIAKSRVQSLKVIKLKVAEGQHDIIFIHSRNHGILLLDLSKSLEPLCHPEPTLLAKYDSFESLFSRGDAIAGSDGTAVLAYPSCLENYLITIRILGEDAQTLISGNASRNNEVRNCPVFDISIKEESQQRYFLFAAFEDGCLVTFSFGPNLTKTVPHLNCKGLDVQQIKKFDLGIGDFISAFDLMLSEDNHLSAVVGSPLKQLMFLDASLDEDSKFETPTHVPLKRQGVSAITIRPDGKIVAIACWDSTVKIFSIRSFKLLACMRHHLKQVHSILFYEKSSQPHDGDPREDRNKIESRYLMCCASMEGTISISSIY